MNSKNRSSKEAVLRRVKQAIDAPQSAIWGREDRRQQELRQIPRGFRTVGALSSGERIALFRSRLDHYGAASHLATGAAEVSRTIQELLRSQKKETVLVTQDVQEDWIPPDIHILRDSDLSHEQLDHLDGVITGCTVAIALTGTVILSAREDGRRALTLVPDYELCIVREDQIVELVPEAIQRLSSLKTTPLTFFSGPSATVDIEMIRVKGVHGPRTLDIVIAMGE